MKYLHALMGCDLCGEGCFGSGIHFEPAGGNWYTFEVAFLSADL
jgi:hypothetical protein